MRAEFEAAELAAAARRVATALKAHEDMLTELDQAVGDGDLGVTAASSPRRSKRPPARTSPISASALARTGMALNRAAPSTMGTLMATALMQAGKTVVGKETLTVADLPRLLAAAAEGVRTRGKANVGDKTLLDAFSRLRTPSRLRFRKESRCRPPPGPCSRPPAKGATE